MDDAAAHWLQTREQLATAIRDKNEALLQGYYNSHFQAVYRYVLCRVDGDHAACEEIVGDVFYQAFRDIAQYQGRLSPERWLLGIARHRLLDYYRRQGRRPVVELVFSQFDEQLTQRLFDLESQSIPEEQLERRELATLVELVLSHLPGDYQCALRLRYLEDRPVKQLAEKLNTTPKAAESLLFRARNAFRDAFLIAAANLERSGNAV